MSRPLGSSATNANGQPVSDATLKEQATQSLRLIEGTEGYPWDTPQLAKDRVASERAAMVRIGGETRARETIAKDMAASHIAVNIIEARDRGRVAATTERAAVTAKQRSDKATAACQKQASARDAACTSIARRMFAAADKRTAYSAKENSKAIDRKSQQAVAKETAECLESVAMARDSAAKGILLGQIASRDKSLKDKAERQKQRDSIAYLNGIRCGDTPPDTWQTRIKSHAAGGSSRSGEATGGLFSRERSMHKFRAAATVRQECFGDKLWGMHQNLLNAIAPVKPQEPVLCEPQGALISCEGVRHLPRARH